VRVADLTGAGCVPSLSRPLSLATSFYAIRRANKELFELEHLAALAVSRYEQGKNHALSLQDIHDSQAAASQLAKDGMQAARLAHDAALDSENQTKLVKTKSEVTLVLAQLSGRVDAYGRQLLALKKNFGERAKVLNTEAEVITVLAYFPVGVVHCATAAQTVDRALAEWLAGCAGARGGVRGIPAGAAAGAARADGRPDGWLAGGSAGGAAPTATGQSEARNCFPQGKKGNAKHSYAAAAGQTLSGGGGRSLALLSDARATDGRGGEPTTGATHCHGTHRIPA
jgi:hypothetical protein